MPTTARCSNGWPGWCRCVGATAARPAAIESAAPASQARKQPRACRAARAGDRGPLREASPPRMPDLPKARPPVGSCCCLSAAPAQARASGTDTLHGLPELRTRGKPGGRTFPGGLATALRAGRHAHAPAHRRRAEQPTPFFPAPPLQGGRKGKIKRHSSRNRCACCPPAEVGGAAGRRQALAARGVVANRGLGGMGSRPTLRACSATRPGHPPRACRLPGAC